MQRVIDRKEIYDYGVRHVDNPKHIIGMSFQRWRMERLVEEWNARDNARNYELVERRRVQTITDWYDPLDTTV